MRTSCLLVLCLATLPAAAKEDLALRVVSVVGDVSVDKKALRPGDSVLVGQTVELGANGALKTLTVVDRSIFDFTEGAVVVVDKGEHVETAGTLRLQKGRLRFAIQPKLTWDLQAQGVKYSLTKTIGALQVTVQGDQSRQIAATREGSVPVTAGERKVGTLSEVDQFVLEGKLVDGVLDFGKAKREAINSVKVRDFISASSVEDPVFLQSVQLGAGESPRARGMTYRFLEPTVELSKNKRPPVAFDDPEHAFRPKTPLYELNGSAVQVRQNANIQ